MTHARHQVRDAIAAALQNLATTKRNVFISRVRPINDEHMPCLLVFTRSEQSEPITQGAPRRIGRAITVMVEGAVKLTEGYDDKLDKMSVEVEKALYNNPSLQALVKDIFLAGTEITLAGESEKPVAVISMSFAAAIHTPENNPETII